MGVGPHCDSIDRLHRLGSSPVGSFDVHRSDDGTRQGRAAPRRRPRGGHLYLLVDPRGPRHMLCYDDSDLEVPARAIALAPDEADQVAEILHSQPIADRLASLERQVRDLIRGAR